MHRPTRMKLGPLVLVTMAFAAGCGSNDSDTGSNASPVGDEADVKVDTRDKLARKQYDADVAFVNAYRPRCPQTGGTNPRVLVTGFGRFMTIANNATGR